MELTDLENQIIQILENKYKHTIDKDDPLILTITAQTLVTEHLLELHKKNLEAEFDGFKDGLKDILNSSKIDSNDSKKVISEYVRKTFLTLVNEYKGQLDPEFLKSGQEYRKAQKWYKSIKIWAIGSVCINLLIGVVIYF